MKNIYLILTIIALTCAAGFSQAPDKSDANLEHAAPTVPASAVGDSAVAVASTRRGVFQNPLARYVDVSSTAGERVSDKHGSGTEVEKRSAGDSDVHVEITPYGWLSGIEGNLRVRNTPVRIDSSGSDVLESVDFALGFRAEISKGRFGFHVDNDYANLGTEGNLNGPLATPYDVQPTINILELTPSYTVYFKPNSDSSLPDVVSIETLGGMRWFHLGLGLKAGNNINQEGSRNIIDVFGGGRLKVRPAPSVTLSTKATLGGGGSHFAWTVNGLIDRRFYRNISVMGGYQVLDMDADDLNNTVGFNGRLKGLIFGMTFYR